MNYDDMVNAVENAEFVDRMANKMVKRLAPIVSKRLRECNWADLERMKKELKRFDCRTGNWRD